MRKMKVTFVAFSIKDQKRDVKFIVDFISDFFFSEIQTIYAIYQLSVYFQPTTMLRTRGLKNITFSPCVTNSEEWYSHHAVLPINVK